MRSPRTKYRVGARVRGRGGAFKTVSNYEIDLDGKTGRIVRISEAEIPAGALQRVVPAFRLVVARPALVGRRQDVTVAVGPRRVAGRRVAVVARARAVHRRISGRGPERPRRRRKRYAAIKKSSSAGFVFRLLGRAGGGMTWHR